MYKNRRISLGFIGVGLMGLPIIHRLLMSDYAVNVWNRSAGNLKLAASAGAAAKKSPPEVVLESDITFLCLASTDVVKSIVLDSPSFMDSLNADKTIVDLSSISPEVTRQISQEILNRTGARWIDAPMSGGVPGAEQGTLILMAGGDEERIKQIHPILMLFAKRITRMGPTGSGQLTKLCNQIIVGCNISAIAEAVRLAEHAGVDAKSLSTALQGGFADSLPFQIFSPRMATRTVSPPSIRNQTMLKDLESAIQAAHDHGLNLELTSTSAKLLRRKQDQSRGRDCITTLVDSE